MPANDTAKNVLGTIGTICWTGQVLPQVYKSWREKSTAGLSPWLMFIWSASGAFLGVYAIVQDISIPIIIQPQLFSTLAAISWVQCLYYEGKRSATVCTSILLFYLALFAGWEVGITYAIRGMMAYGNHQPFLDICGIASGVLICAGLIPQFIEIYKRRQVIGISMTFLAIDISGAVFSLLSLIFKDKFDGIAAITYLGVVVLDGVIVVLAWTLNPIKKRKTREQALEQGMGAVDTAPDTLETQSRIITSREREDREGEKNIESDET